MKNLFKKSIGFMLAAVVAMQGMTAFAATTYQDGDVGLCLPSEIYVDEDFSTKPATVNSGTWKFSGNSVNVKDGVFTTTAKGVGEFTFDTPVTKSGAADASDKLAVSFDVTRMGEGSGSSEFFRIGCGSTVYKDLRMTLSDDKQTYSITMIYPTKEGPRELVEKIPVGEFVNIQVVCNLSGEYMTMDIYARNSEGELVGNQFKDYRINNKDVPTSEGVQSLTFTNWAQNPDKTLTESIKFDNVKVYNYLDAPEIDMEQECIENCQDTDIFVNETFSGEKLPAGNLANGLGKWEFKSAAALTEGALSIPSGKDGALLKLNTPIEENGSKYVFSYDFCNDNNPTDGIIYGFNIGCDGTRHGKPIVIQQSANSETYQIKVGNKFIKVADGVSYKTWVNIKLVITVEETGWKCDATVSDMNGKILGKAADIDFISYGTKDIETEEGIIKEVVKGVDYFNWGFGGDYKVDNIKLYKYATVPEAGEISSPRMPGVPLPGSDGYILNENFDNRSMVARGEEIGDTTWSCASGTLGVFTERMLSGRRVLKLSDGLGWTAITLKSPMAYSAEDNANNRYVLKFDFKCKRSVGSTASYNVMRFNFTDNNNKSTNVAPLIVLSNGDFKNSADCRYVPVNDWCTVAAIIDMTATEAIMNFYICDGANTTKLSKPVSVPTTSLPTIQLSGGGIGAASYFDNIQLYKAGTEIAKGEEPVTAAKNIKLTTADGDAALNALPANTDVFVSADFATSNDNPVEYVPQGVFVAYKKLADGRLELAGVDIVNLNKSVSNVLQKMAYAPEKALFTSDSEGGEYVVQLLMWKDMLNITPYCAAQELGE